MLHKQVRIRENKDAYYYNSVHLIYITMINFTKYHMLSYANFVIWYTAFYFPEFIALFCCDVLMLAIDNTSSCLLYIMMSYLLSRILY